MKYQARGMQVINIDNHSRMLNGYNEDIYCDFLLIFFLRGRVSSVVEHLSANPKVPGSIPGLVSYRRHGLQ